MRQIVRETNNNRKPDLAESAGCLQLCAGQKSGCKAAPHDMREIYEQAETEAILLIDA